MPLPHANKVAKLVMKARLLGQDCFSVFFVEGAADWDTPGLTDLATNAVAAWKAQLIPQCCSDYTLLSAEALDLSASENGSVEVPCTTGCVGTAGGLAGLPNSVSIAVKKTTAVGGRGGRGRVFFPIQKTDRLVSGNQVSTSFITTLCAAYTAFHAAIDAGAVNSPSLGIVSYYLNKVLRPSPLFRDIVSFVCTDNNVDSQRRRLAGRGR